MPSLPVPRRLAAAALVSTAALLAPLGASAATPTDGGSGGARAKTAARAFLTRYVRADGRTVRSDQGGDTVAAGQAQAMLLGVAVGDARRFAATWSWTQRHLQRKDRLLASHWRAGKVINAQSASDADLDAARALVLGARRFHRPAYRTAGLRIGRAVLAEESARLGGRLVLVAGPWARADRPAAVNPSYVAPRGLEQLASAAHDARFSRLATGSTRAIAALSATATHLPPDWGAVSSTGRATPTSVPGRRPAPPRFSFVAARTLVRLAESCTASDRALAAAAWPFFAARPPQSIGVAYALDGRALDPAQSAVTLVGAAAAAQSAGQPAARDALLEQATRVDDRFPTYYGAAWLALARVTLATSELGSCHGGA